MGATTIQIRMCRRLRLLGRPNVDGLLETGLINGAVRFHPDWSRRISVIGAFRHICGLVMFSLTPPPFDPSLVAEKKVNYSGFVWIHRGYCGELGRARPRGNPGLRPANPGRGSAVSALGAASYLAPVRLGRVSGLPFHPRWNFSSSPSKNHHG